MAPDSAPVAQSAQGDQPGQTGQSTQAFQPQAAPSAAAYFSQPSATSASQPGAHGDAGGEPGYQVSDAIVLGLQIRAMGRGHGARPAKPTPPAVPAVQESLNLKREEDHLQAALKSMGLSPGAIQEFMYIGRVLAQAAPSLFQNFVAQMVNLAGALQSAGSLGPTPRLTTAAAPASRAQLGVISIQEAESAVRITQTAQGVTLNVTAEAQVFSLADIQLRQGGAPLSTAAPAAGSPAIRNHTSAASPQQTISATA